MMDYLQNITYIYQKKSTSYILEYIPLGMSMVCYVLQMDTVQ